MTKKHLKAVLGQPDIEMIEKSIYRSADDLAVSIARSLERLEERIDTMETRIQNELNERIQELAAAKQELASS